LCFYLIFRGFGVYEPEFQENENVAIQISRTSSKCKGNYAALAHYMKQISRKNNNSSASQISRIL
jgi:hypothetical protein